MNIILFGGAFDPPHLGHQQVVSQVLTLPIADEVWYVPVKNHNFGKKMTDAKHRLAMLEMILEPKTKIEHFELESPAEKVNYTYDTLQALVKKYPQHHFFWLIGADNLPDFSKWNDYQEMLAEFTFYVYPRERFAMEPLLPGMEPLTQLETVKVSSTEIRERVKAGQSIEGMVDPKVAQYITKHSLY